MLCPFHHGEYRGPPEVSDAGRRGEDTTYKQRTKGEGEKGSFLGPQTLVEKALFAVCTQRNPNQCPDKPQITAAPGYSQKQNKRVGLFMACLLTSRGINNAQGLQNGIEHF